MSNAPEAMTHARAYSRGETEKIMGMDIGFHRLAKDPTKRWIDKAPADDAPEHFTHRFEGRGAYTNLIFDVPHEYIKTCGCGERCGYGCSGDAVYRPTDFAAFREKLRTEGMYEPAMEEDYDGEKVDGNQIFREMTDWLEQHPDVYVDFG
jgi:hypothetical protein